MRKVEALRVRLGMSKTELAAKLETTTDALRAWMTGRTIGQKETVAKIEAFVRQNVMQTQR
jgi:DNA-binding transcriptional regulator YiaG